MNAYLPPSRGPKPTQSELVWVSFYTSSHPESEGPLCPLPMALAQTPPRTGSVLLLGFTPPGCAIRSPVPPLSEALGVVGPRFPLHNMGLTSVLLAWRGCWESVKGWEKTGGLTGAV